MDKSFVDLKWKECRECRRSIAEQPRHWCLQEPVAGLAHEFPFSDADFRHLAQVAYDYAGIALADSKRNLVYSRLSRRLRALRMTSFREYREFLASDRDARSKASSTRSRPITPSSSAKRTISIISARTSRFRSRSRGGRNAGGRLRVWSAGCSSGEEPYTIARRAEARDSRHRAAATSAFSRPISTPTSWPRRARGEFAATAFDEIPKPYHPFFNAEESEGAVDKVVMDKDVKSLITFRRLNLMEPWPFNGKFDAIFCRNVMIYFDGADQVDAGRSLHAATQAGRLALHRPFGIADRIASRTAARRPHDLPEDRMSVALAQKPAGQCRQAPRPSQATAGRRFFDTTPFRLDGEGVSRASSTSRGKPDEILVTVLGSCVSACIRDPIIGIGGMNHFMLAKGRTGGWGDDPQSARFGNFAMEKLINELIKAGCSRERMEIKVFGGGNVIDASTAVGSAQRRVRPALSRGRRVALRRRGPRRTHPAAHPLLSRDRPRRAPAARNRRNLRDQPRGTRIRRPAAVAAACGRNPSVWRCGVTT